MDDTLIATNRRAFHDYQVLETFQAGLVLEGPEVKSVRAGKIVLKDGYAQIERGTVRLRNVHISPYALATNVLMPDPERPRTLLLHRREIAHIDEHISQKGCTLIPLRVYFRNGFAKVDVALCKGKKKFDKRQSIKERQIGRDIQRAIRQKRSG